MVALAPRPYTYREYALIQPDGKIWELIDGDFYVNPAPLSFHQIVSRRLQYALMTLLELPGIAAIFDAPTDVILSDTTTVQPDLAIVAMARKAIVSERGIEGAPDIVVEILSQRADYDRVLKRKAYERHGVPEYWIVDPFAFTVEVLRLDAGAYGAPRLFRADETLTSPSFDGLIDVALAPIFAPL